MHTQEEPMTETELDTQAQPEAEPDAEAAALILDEPAEPFRDEPGAIDDDDDMSPIQMVPSRSLKKKMATFLCVCAPLMVVVVMLEAAPTAHPGRNIRTLNDPTIHLSDTVKHSWLDYYDGKTRHKPKTRLILTDFGWNYPDKDVGLLFYRSKRSRELLQGFIDNPHFDPTFSWTEMANGNLTEEDPDVQNVVLLDIETCFEGNYPHYSDGKTPDANADRQGGRAFYLDGTTNPCWYYNNCSPYIQDVLDSPLFQSLPSSTTLVFITCTAQWSWDERFQPITDQQMSDQLQFVSISAGPGQILNPQTEMGLPPPAVKSIQLNQEEQDDIETCMAEDRFFFLSFIGNERKEWSPRDQLLKFNNDRDILMMRTGHFDQYYKGVHTYEEVMRLSKFAATPRGDCLYSYRFTEVLSAGAIPVVHADGWMLPFRPELVDWRECAVVIPEKDVGKTLDILYNISDEKRCQMRQKCYQIFKEYIEKPEGVIDGIVGSIMARKEAGN